MEMTFPPLGRNQQTSQTRADIRALLATAIARQANGRTARVVMAERRTGPYRARWSADIVEQRIQYFSAHDENQFSDSQRPVGAFFPTERAVFNGERNDEAHVYQEASANIKARAVEPDMAEQQPEHAGHGQSRTL